MRRIGLATVITAILALLIVGCGKNKLPETFNSLNPVAREYLMAAIEEGDHDAYKCAIAWVDEPEMKTKIADYASESLFGDAQINSSTRGAFHSLELAIEIELCQQNKEKIIDSSMRMAGFYARKNDTYYSPLAAHFLMVCAKFTSEPGRREEFLNRAAAIYEEVAERVSHRKAAEYLTIASNLRQGNL